MELKDIARKLPEEIWQVFEPLLPQVMNRSPDPRDLPSVHGDGAYGNEPSRRRAQDSGFRMRAPRRGQRRIPAIGRIRRATFAVVPHRGLDSVGRA
jgi:hypothetical protein